MKFIKFFFLLSFFFTSFGVAQAQSEEGTLRLIFQDFQYFTIPTNPPGGDWRSYNKLGDLTTYIIRVIPATSLREFIKSARIYGKKGFGDINWEAGYVKIYETRTCYTNGNNHATIINTFKKGQEIKFLVSGQDHPSHVDIPLAPGDYFIYYSVFFQHAQIQSSMFVFPNYNGLDGTNNSELEWGVPYIEVSNGSVANVTFAPTWKSSACNYNAITYDDDNFRNCEEFYNYVDYLIRIRLLESY